MLSKNFPILKIKAFFAKNNILKIAFNKMYFLILQEAHSTRL